MSVTLTVFFDDPFWIGLFEQVDESRLRVAKVVFGAEPSEREVWDCVLNQYDGLRFSPPMDGAKAMRMASNPKRRQRQAAKAQTAGVGTKAQQAMQLAHEEGKQARKELSKERREAEEARRLQIHIEKKKAKHRGH